MNASILCLLGLLSAPPAGDAPHTTSQPETEVVTVFRGQSPGFQAPIVIQGDGSTPTFQSGPVPAGPNAFGPPVSGGPVLGDPSFGGPAFGGQPLPPSTVIQPSVDPFLPSGPPPPGSPLAGNGLVFGGYYFGYEAVIVKPFFTSNGAVNAQSITNPRNDRLIDFDWGLEYSTRYTLGYSGGDGFGGRVRYWEFGEDADESAVASRNQMLTNEGINRGFVFANPGQRFVARQNLELDVLDAEGTFHRDNASHAFTASVGARFAEIDEELTTAAFAGTGALTGLSVRDYNFRGVGPTVSLLGRKRLWTTNWAIFSSGRFSLLYGESQENSSGQDSLGSFSFEHNSYDRIVPVIELQSGVEWSRCCECFGGSTFFARAALEGQSWIDALPNGDLGFLGASFGAGWAF